MLAKPSFFYSVRFPGIYKIARGTPPNPGGEFLLQTPHKWPISRRGLKPATTMCRTLIPNVVAGFSPRSSKGVSGVESKVTSREEKRLESPSAPENADEQNQNAFVCCYVCSCCIGVFKQCPYGRKKE